MIIQILQASVVCLSLLLKSVPDDSVGGCNKYVMNIYGHPSQSLGGLLPVVQAERGNKYTGMTLGRQFSPGPPV